MQRPFDHLHPCPFVLSAPLQKHFKRKKSLIDWALRRSVSTPTGSPASQSPTNSRKLFGLSLTSVCPDGTLPKPIMVRCASRLTYQSLCLRGVCLYENSNTTKFSHLFNGIRFYPPATVEGKMWEL